MKIDINQIFQRIAELDVEDEDIIVEPGAISYKFRGMGLLSRNLYAEAMHDFSLEIRELLRIYNSEMNINNDGRRVGTPFRTIPEIYTDIQIMLYFRGLSFKGQGRYLDAINDFTKSIEITGCFTPAIAERASTLILLGEIEQAISDCDRLLDVDPSFLWALIKRGELLLQLGNNDRALADFEMAYQVDPDYFFCIYFRAEALSGLGRYKEAINVLESVLLRKPGWDCANELLIGLRRLINKALWRFPWLPLHLVVPSEELPRLNPRQDDANGNSQRAINKCRTGRSKLFARSRFRRTQHF